MVAYTADRANGSGFWRESDLNMTIEQHLDAGPHGGQDNPPEENGEHRAVEIVVNKERVIVPREVTGKEIKAAARVDPAFNLYGIQGDHEDPVADDQRITVHEGERFIATPKLDPS
jgi:hypothetical protein